MWLFQKIDPLGLVGGCRVISLVGGGGKTTVSEVLAERIAAAGGAAIVTTTTKIGARNPFTLFSDSLVPSRNQFTRVGKAHEGEKLTGLSYEEVESLSRSADAVFVEADGARRLPVKYPAPHEPLIPPFSDRIFVVAGLDALHGLVEEKLFRWKLLAERTGLRGSDVITPDLFAGLFSESGMLKDVDRTKCTVILNKYDSLADRGEALLLARRLLERGTCPEVMVANAKRGIFYRVIRG